LLHQVSHSNSKTTINADRRGNKGSRIVIEAIDKKLALLFVKQGGSSVSAALLNGVAFFFAGKGRVAALLPLVGWLFGSSLVSPCCPVLKLFQLRFCRLYILFPHRPLILK
jgi:hypothetical protein